MGKKKWQSQWLNHIQCEGMEPEVLARMSVLRRQLLLHAYIYYNLGENIISDHEWDRRGQEHLALMKEHGWNINFYDEIFRNYDGQSAYWFPTNKTGWDDNVHRVAMRILDYDKKLASEGCIKTDRGHIPKEIA